MSSQGPRSSQIEESPYFLDENGMDRVEYLRQLFQAIESRTFKVKDDTLTLICDRLTELTATEFDIFISIMFEYLIQWEEKRNFELLGLIVEVFDVVLRLAPPPLQLEIRTALISLDLWHVKLFICWELFGVPEGEIVQEKLPDAATIPLELCLCVKSGSYPPESLLNRIYGLKDDITYRFCAIVSHQLFGIEDYVYFDTEIEEICEKVKVLKSKHGSKAVPRIRNALSQELLRADP